MSESMAEALARLDATRQSVATIKGRLRACLYGPSDGGKTKLAAELLDQIVPADKIILYVDTSDGVVSLQNHPHLLRRTEVIPFTTVDDLNVIAAACLYRAGFYANVGGIVLDEGSSMVQQDIDNKWSDRGSSDLTPAWPDYHAGLAAFRSMLANFFLVPGLHVVVTAHEKDKKNKAGDVISVYPSFPAEIAKKVKEPMQLVARLTAEYVPVLGNPDAEPNYSRVAQVHSTPAVDAKSRIGGLPVKVSDTGLIQVVKDWADKGGVEVEELPEQPDPEPKPDPNMSTEEVIEAAAESSADAVNTEADMDFAPIPVA